MDWLKGAYEGAWRLIESNPKIALWVIVALALLVIFT